MHFTQFASTLRIVDFANGDCRNDDEYDSANAAPQRRPEKGFVFKGRPMADYRNLRHCLANRQERARKDDRKSAKRPEKDSARFGQRKQVVGVE
jgi:hypothetical protein